MCPMVSPILLIEDNPIDLDLTRRAFFKRRLTNPIEVARDGEEALSFIDRWDAGEPTPAVILLDLKLPKVNGLEFLREIKRYPRYKTIPVIVLTISSHDGDIGEAYQLGANSYIVKPVNFEKFLDVVGQMEIYWCVMNSPEKSS
jgi:CheY-like chemotaxis protein